VRTYPRGCSLSIRLRHLSGQAVSTKKYISLLLAMVSIASIVLAQLPTGTILGDVKGATGALIPGAMLTATNLESGLSRTATAGEDGAYRFSALPVGRYEVKAAFMGFQTAVRTGLNLEVGQDAVVNFTLQVGELTQTVQVEAEASLVNTTSSSLGGVVNEASVSELPLNGRNYIDLTFLQPGVSRNENTTSGGTFVGSWYSSNGAPLRSNSYMLDGAVMGNVLGGTASSVANATLGLEGIREWRVVTNNFSAEYGLAMGSQMAIVTKSGTNNFHGSLFEYFRNSALDARNFFDYQTPQTPGRLPPFRRNNFGGSFGGPVKKDKLFFFVTYESLHERFGVTTISPDIPANCRTEPLPAGCRPDNGTTIDPRVKPWLAQFPLPNSPGTNYTFPFNRPTTEHYGQGRFDYTLSGSDSMFGRYTQDQSALLAVLLYPQFTTDKFSLNRYMTVSETHIFSAALLNTARFSYSDTNLKLTSPTDLHGPQYDLVAGKGFGDINISGIGEFGPRFSAPIRQFQQVYSWSDDMFWTKGAHSIKFGTLINRYMPFYTSGAASIGTLIFADYRNFLAGNSSRFTAKAPGAILDSEYRYNTLGFYVQDDWRVHSRLTLNLGLRYETITDPYEINGRGSSIRNLYTDPGPTCLDPLCVQGSDPEKLIENPTRLNFSPRVGFAWDVFGDGKTAIRAGAAILYDINTFNSGVFALGYPYSTTKSLTGAAAASFTLPVALPAGAGGRTAGGSDFNINQPYSFQDNFSVEQALPWTMALSVSYAGTRGIHLYRRAEQNPRFPFGTPVNGVCVNQGRTTFSLSQPYCWLGTEPLLTSNWGSANRMVADSNSWYHGLQVGLRKRFSQGLQFQTSYTYSKAIDETQGLIDAENTASHFMAANPFDRAQDRSPSSFDLRHNFSFNALYALPNVNSSSGAVKALADGWRLGSIFRYRTGFPFSPVLGGNRSRSAVLGGTSGLDRPDFLPGVKAEDTIDGTSRGCDFIPAGTPVGTPNLWFDPCAFSLPAAGFLGNAGRNSMRGPGLTNVDFSVSKDTPLPKLGEGGKLEFRAEFFNILNHANFATPEVGVADYPSAAVIFPGSPTSITEQRLPSVAQILKTSTTSRQIQLSLRLLF